MTEQEFKKLASQNFPEAIKDSHGVYILNAHYYMSGGIQISYFDGENCKHFARVQMFEDPNPNEAIKQMKDKLIEAYGRFEVSTSQEYMDHLYPPDGKTEIKTGE